MSHNFNEVILCGRVTSAPDFVTTTKGVQGIKFNFGVDRTTTEGERGTDVFHVAAYGDLADKIHRLCHKTTEMLIRGSLRPLPYGGGADIKADFVSVDYKTPESGCAYTKTAVSPEQTKTTEG